MITTTHCGNCGELLFAADQIKTVKGVFADGEMFQRTIYRCSKCSYFTAVTAVTHFDITHLEPTPTPKRPLK